MISFPGLPAAKAAIEGKPAGQHLFQHLAENLLDFKQSGNHMAGWCIYNLNPEKNFRFEKFCVIVV
jgi:hypothetical protein